MIKHHHASRCMPPAQLRKVALAPEQIKNHREFTVFLKSRFGKELINDRFIESESALKRIQESYDRAYLLTRHYLEKNAHRIKGIPRLTRRNYLKVMGAFLTSVTIPFATSSCSPPCKTIQEEEGQAGSPIPGPTAEANVAMAGGESSIEEKVRTAVSMAGGLDEIHAGDTVIIKPNCVWDEGKQAPPYA